MFKLLTSSTFLSIVAILIKDDRSALAIDFTLLDGVGIRCYNSICKFLVVILRLYPI